MGAAAQRSGEPERYLVRDDLSATITTTPVGGVCVICAPPGFGARTLVTRTLGEVVTWRPSSNPGLSAALLDAWDQGQDWVHVEGLHRDRDPEAVAELERLLHGPRDQGRLIVTTATDLGRALAESRLAGRLVEVDQSDLTLTEDQTAEMLKDSVQGVDPRDLRELVRLCGGWVAAVRMAARRATQHPGEDTTGWLRTRGAELLLGPWLDDCDPQAREMLIATSFLDVLHPDLVAAVLPGSGAAAALLTLARDPGPVRPAPQPTRLGQLGYERHPLLTELLRHVALAHPAPADAHVRAAAWHREHGDVTGELENLFAAGRSREATRRLFAHEDELLSTGRADDALRWYERSSAKAPPADLSHLLRIGWAAALSGDFSSAAAAVGRLSSAVAGQPDGEARRSPAYVSLAGEVEVLSCWLAHAEGDISLVVAAASRAADLFEGDLSRNSHQLAPVYLARGLTLLGRLTEAEAVLAPVRTRAFALGAVIEDSRAEVEAELAWEQGRIHQSRAWSSRRLRAAGSDAGPTAPGRRPPVAHWLAESEAGRTAAALDGLAAVLREASEMPVTVVTDLVVVHLALAHVHLRRAQHREALVSTSAAKALVQAHSPVGGLLSTIARSEARTRLLSGDVVRADRVLRGLDRGTEALLLRARAGLMRGSPLARQMLREVEPTSPRLVVEHALLSAWAQREHSRRAAELELFRAAEVSTAHGLTSGLVGVPADVLAFARSTAQHFVDDGLQLLVTVAEPVDRPVDDALASAPSTALVMLTRGELQLATLLPGRLSNAELAQALGVSVNTVKTRLRRLFLKLEVHDRRQAVARVEELGLTPGQAPGVGRD